MAPPRHRPARHRPCGSNHRSADDPDGCSARRHYHRNRRSIVVERSRQHTARETGTSPPHRAALAGLCGDTIDIPARLPATAADVPTIRLPTCVWGALVSDRRGACLVDGGKQRILMLLTACAKNAAAASDASLRLPRRHFANHGAASSSTINRRPNGRVESGADFSPQV
jgi:hypothetical protein